jgi:uncharacterized membrane protein
MGVFLEALDLFLVGLNVLLFFGANWSFWLKNMSFDEMVGLVTKVVSENPSMLISMKGC